MYIFIQAYHQSLENIIAARLMLDGYIKKSQPPENALTDGDDNMVKDIEWLKKSILRLNEGWFFNRKFKSHSG